MNSVRKQKELLPIKCSHTSSTITHICLAPDCKDRILCAKCEPGHNGFHASSIKPFESIFDLVQKGHVSEIKYKINDKGGSYKRIITYYNKMLDKIESEIQEKIKSNKSVVLVDFDEKYFSEFYDLADTINKSLKNPKGFVSTSKSISQLDKYLDKYADLQDCIELLEKVFKEHDFSSLSYKDIQNRASRLLSSFEESIGAFQKAFFFPPKKDLIDDPQEYAKFQFDFSETPSAEIKEQVQSFPIFDLDNLRKELSFKLPTSPNLNSIEYLESQELVLIGDRNGNLGFWDTKSWKCLATERFHKSSVNAIKYSPKYQSIFTASDDYTIKVIKTTEPAKIDDIKSLYKHTNKVWSLLLLDEHDTFYSSGKEAGIFGWDLKTLEVKHKLDTRGREHTGDEMAFISDHNLLAVSFQEGTVSLYSIDSLSEYRVLDIETKEIHFLKFVEVTNQLMVGTEGGTLKVWDAVNLDGMAQKEWKIPGGKPIAGKNIQNECDLIVTSGFGELIQFDSVDGEYKTTDNCKFDNIQAIQVLHKKNIILVVHNGIEVDVLKY